MLVCSQTTARSFSGVYDTVKGANVNTERRQLENRRYLLLFDALAAVKFQGDKDSVFMNIYRTLFQEP